MKRLLVAIVLVVMAGQVVAGVMGHTRAPALGQLVRQPYLKILPIPNPIPTDSTGVLDSAVIWATPAYGAGDTVWALVYLNATRVAAKPDSVPDSCVGISNYSITTGTGGVNESLKVAFSGETWEDGTDSIWVGIFVSPNDSTTGRGARIAIAELISAADTVWVNGHKRDWYKTFTYGVAYTIPGSGYDWKANAVRENTTAGGGWWIQVFYHILGAATDVPHIVTVPSHATGISFSGVAGGSNPASQNLVLTNTGTGTMPWKATIVEASAWLGIAPDTADAPGTITVSCDISGQTAGVYHDSIRVRCEHPNVADNTPVYVPVTLTVTSVPQPQIFPIPDTMTFAMNLHEAPPAAQDLELINIGDSTMAWKATNDSSWMVLSADTADDNDTISVSIDTTGVLAGTHLDTLWIACSNATNTPYAIPVVLVVSTPKHRIMVKKATP